MIEQYFDNAATTPIDPEVLASMLPWLSSEFGNAHSLHSSGRRAADAVEVARAQVAELIGAEDPSQITFTSGATEANNWILRSFERVAVSPFEHDSLLLSAKMLGKSFLRNVKETIVAPTEEFDLLSVMAVNNETGTRWERPQTLAGAPQFHSDLTQAVGKLPFDMHTIDFASLSGHKFYGPKGVGALYSKDFPPSPFHMGGEQESGRRAGTLNVPAIVGMGTAARIAKERQEHDYALAEQCSQTLIQNLTKLSDWQINGGSFRSPYILSLSILGLQGESLVIEADRANFSISSGAACSSSLTEPSHVLEALDLPPEWSKGTIRISFGRFNSLSTTEELADTLMTAVERLRSLKS